MRFRHSRDRSKGILDVPDDETTRINILSRPDSPWKPIIDVAPVSAFDAREAELKKMTVKDLQQIAGDGQEGWKKADYVEAVLKSEFPTE